MVITKNMLTGQSSTLHSLSLPVVQLTWMAYDMVVLRTNPELGVSMRKLEEAYRKCSTAVYGGPGQEPQGDTCSKTDTIELTEM